jgi:hypothetical protein
MQNETAVKVVPMSIDTTSFLADPLYGDRWLLSDSDIGSRKDGRPMSRLVTPQSCNYDV